MASSSRGSEGAKEIPEDLVLSWTRDATTIDTFGTFGENDRQRLEELIQCVHEEKGANATKQKLSVVLGTGEDRKPVVIRARVLTTLIAIALGLRPEDITIDSKTGKESLRSSVDFQTALRLRLAEALQDDNSVQSYLFKDALEADDEVMTVILCDPQFFEKYPIPYFHGCDLAVVQEISNLWLSQEIRRGFYYYTVLEPLFNQVRGEELEVKGISDEKSVENLLKATMMLCELLRRRTVKAGARLLEVIFSFRKDRMFHVLELVKGLVIPLVGFKNGIGNGKFRRCFFGGFENLAQEGQQHSQGSDQVRGRHGESITVGPSCAQTDSNLLCWAARRGYFNLVWCISLGYVKARPMYPTEKLLEDATEELVVSLLWKVALWCATRHGQKSVVMELARPKWVKNINFNDYTGIERCLPPLHLVSLLGDTRLLHILFLSQAGIRSTANTRDYLGKSPFDYAMQFQHQSCIQELLQVPVLSHRLNELNDMYTTQVNFVLVGAALIATVAFAGWLQPPLGYADYFQFTQPSPLAPEGTYEHYIAVEGHLSVQMFVVFNTLSLFSSIGTMLIGIEGTLFFHDNNERTIALMKIRKSMKWMHGFFITSIVCIMVAFICAGLAILPPIQRLEWSMIISLCLGACSCLIPLTWILSSSTKDQIVKLKDQVKLILQNVKEASLDDSFKYLDQSLENLHESLVNEEDMKILEDEIQRKLQNEKARKSSGKGKSRSHEIQPNSMRE